jgi:hypothetical protein
MTTKNLILVFFSLVLFYACSKDDVNNPPTDPNEEDTTTYKPGRTLLVDDLVLYTSGGAHRDVQMIKNFVTRHWPEHVNKFDYGQTSIDYNNNSLSLIFLDNNKVKLRNIIMEIVSKTDTQMLLSPMDSTDMPGTSMFGRCMQLYDQVPQYNPWSICNAAGGNCKKYRKVCPVIISGNNYYLPLLKSALVSNCNILTYDSSPLPNYFNKNILNGMLKDKDTLLVEICRLPITK